eukprot:1683950-Pyramimonas_sp.AAC.1
MRSFWACLNPQKIPSFAPDQMLRAGEDPRCQDQGRDLLQGATVPSPWWRPVGTLTLTARRRRKADAQEKLTSQKVHVGIQYARVAPMHAISAPCNGAAQSVTQWASIIARISPCNLSRTRPGWQRLTLRESL